MSEQNKQKIEISNNVLMQEENLKQAIISNNLLEVEKILQTGVNISKNREWALNLATDYDRLEVIKLLVKFEANIKSVSDILATTAIEKGYLDILEYLDNNGYIDIYNENNFLLTAIESGQLEIVKYLIKHNTDLYIGDNNLLDIAAKYGKLDIVKYLLENKIDIIKYGENASYIALKNGHNDIFKYITEKQDEAKKKTEIKDKEEKKLKATFITLHKNQLEEDLKNAAIRGDLLTINLLTSKGIRNNEAILAAIEKGRLDVIEYFVDKNIVFDLDDLFLDAVEYNKLEIVKYLVKKGANIHVYNDTAIKTAALNNSLDILKYLISENVSLHVDNERPLKNAIMNKHMEVIKYLVELGAVINNSILDIAYDTKDNNVINYIQSMYDKQSKILKPTLTKDIKENKEIKDLTTENKENKDSIKLLNDFNKQLFTTDLLIENLRKINNTFTYKLLNKRYFEPSTKKTDTDILYSNNSVSSNYSYIYGINNNVLLNLGRSYFITLKNNTTFDLSAIDKKYSCIITYTVDYQNKRNVKITLHNKNELNNLINIPFQFDLINNILVLYLSNYCYVYDLENFKDYKLDGSYYLIFIADSKYIYLFMSDNTITKINRKTGKTDNMLKINFMLSDPINITDKNIINVDGSIFELESENKSYIPDIVGSGSYGVVFNSERYNKTYTCSSEIIPIISEKLLKNEEYRDIFKLSPEAPNQNMVQILPIIDPTQQEYVYYSQYCKVTHNKYRYKYYMKHVSDFKIYDILRMCYTPVFFNLLINNAYAMLSNLNSRHLIHFDINTGNILYKSNRFYLIDFDTLFREDQVKEMFEHVDKYSKNFTGYIFHPPELNLYIGMSGIKKLINEKPYRESLEDYLYRLNYGMPAGICYREFYDKSTIFKLYLKLVGMSTYEQKKYISQWFNKLNYYQVSMAILFRIMDVPVIIQAELTQLINAIKKFVYVIPESRARDGSEVANLINAINKIYK